MADNESLVLPVYGSPLSDDAWTRMEEQPTVAFPRMIVTIAKKLLLSDGEVAVIANVLGFNPEDRSQMMHYLIPLWDFTSDERGKNVLAAVMPGTLKKLHAFCVVTVMEAWILTGSEGKTMDEMRAEQRRYPDLAHHPTASRSSA